MCKTLTVTVGVIRACTNSVNDFIFAHFRLYRFDCEASAHSRPAPALSGVSFCLDLNQPKPVVACSRHHIAFMSAHDQSISRTSNSPDQVHVRKPVRSQARKIESLSHKWH
jgi:hypothetical protein